MVNVSLSQNENCGVLGPKSTPDDWGVRIRILRSKMKSPFCLCGFTYLQSFLANARDGVWKNNKEDEEPEAQWSDS